MVGWLEAGLHPTFILFQPLSHARIAVDAVDCAGFQLTQDWPGLSQRKIGMHTCKRKRCFSCALTQSTA